MAAGKMTVRNPARERLQKGELAIGIGLHFGSGLLRA